LNYLREVGVGQRERETEPSPLASRKLRHRAHRAAAVGATHLDLLAHQPLLVVEAKLELETARRKLATVPVCVC